MWNTTYTTDLLAAPPIQAISQAALVQVLEEKIC